MLELPRFYARFALLHPHEYLEFRFLKYGHTQQRWIRPEEITDLTPWIQEQDRNGWNCYLSVNPRQQHKATKTGVTSVVCFHADCDSSLFDWPSDVPKPSMTVYSGRGHHFYWEFNAPVLPSPMIEAVNSGLAIKLNADRQCRDISRVLRIPGTINHKFGYDVTLDESHDFRYKPEDFAHIVELGSQLVGAPRQQIAQRIFPHVSLELRSKFEFARQIDPGLARAYRGEIGDGSSDSRYAMAARLVENGNFTAEEVGSLIVDRRWYNNSNRKVCPPDRVLRDANRLIALLFEKEVA